RGRPVMPAPDPAHHPPAADLTARFEPPVHPQNGAPGREQAFTLHRPPEHDAVAPQQLPCDRLRDLLLGQERAMPHPRPPPRRLDPEGRDFPPPAVAAARPP